MPAPTRHDAITVLVFVVVASVSLILMAFALGVAGRFTGFSTDYLIEKITALVVAAAGGGWAAFKYRQKGDA